MSAMPHTWVWHCDAFASTDNVTPDPDSPEAVVLVADSYVVDAGRVRAWPWHRERFASMAAAHVDTAEAQRIWDAAAQLVPRIGRFWPRLQLNLCGDTLLWTLRLRAAPQWSGTARLWPAPRDPRTQPRVKGPDLHTLAALQTQARAAGADEALLLGDDGRIREAGYAALAWWRDDCLHVVDSALPILPSVTRRVLLAAATDAGVRVAATQASVYDLDGAETWLLSAGGNLRYVTAWVGIDVTPGLGVRAPQWRLYLDRWRQPLP